MRAAVDEWFDALTDNLRVLDCAKIRLWDRDLTVQRSSRSQSYVGDRSVRRITSN